VYDVVVELLERLTANGCPKHSMWIYIEGAEDEGGPQVGRWGGRDKKSVDVVLGEAET